MKTRRDFLKQSGIAAAGLAAGGMLDRKLMAAELVSLRHADDMPSSDVVRELMMTALDAARSGGATYSDVRIGRYRSSSLSTREQQIVNTSDTDSVGAGIRALVDGTWGFAATSRLTKDGVTAAAREAIVIAKANRIARDQAGAARALGGPQGRDLEERLHDRSVHDPDRAARRAPAEGERGGDGGEGSELRQLRARLHQGGSELREQRWLGDRADGRPLRRALSGHRDRTRRFPDARQRDRADAARLGVRARAGPRRQRRPVGIRGGAEALGQTSRTPGATISSCTRRTSGSRSTSRSGTPRSWTGRWATRRTTRARASSPRRSACSARCKYGPEFMNVRGDRSEPGACATIGYDDEGVQPEDFLIIKNGVLNDYQTTREQASWLEWWYDKQRQPVRSHGYSNARSWSAVQFQRMPNVSLLPGERDIGWDDLIAATDRGIAIVGDGSFSIDQQRYNAQFGGQVFYEISGRQDRRDAEGRRLSDADAGFLERDGHDRWQGQLPARVRVQRRQGSAPPDRTP